MAFDSYWLGVVPVAFEMAGVVVICKLADSDVCWIRREAPHGRRLRAIAKAFGVTERYLFNVIWGDARPNVPRSTPAGQLKLKFKQKA